MLRVARLEKIELSHPSKKWKFFEEMKFSRIKPILNTWVKNDYINIP